jgi:hypothetical protein
LEKKSDGKKLQNCDLLEVYSGSDKEKLKSTLSSVNWSTFVKNDNIFNNINENEDDNTFKFTDEATEDYKKIIEAQVASTGKNTSIAIDDEEIDIDEI